MDSAEESYPLVADEDKSIGKQCIPMPCGVCKSHVHRACLEKLISQSCGPSPSKREVAILARPDHSLTVCAQCTVCQHVFEYRADTGTHTFKRIAAVERLTRQAERTPTMVMPASVAFVYSIGCALSYLDVVTREQMVGFFKRLGNALANVSERQIANVIMYCCVPSCLVGVLLWAIGGLLFLMYVCYMLLNVMGYI